MPKTYSSNKNLNYEKKNKIRLYQNQTIDQKRVVDINQLLNRVKVDKKKELKKNVILFSLITLITGFIATFLFIF
jgi:hypothetical protein